MRIAMAVSRHPLAARSLSCRRHPHCTGTAQPGPPPAAGPASLAVCLPACAPASPSSRPHSLPGPLLSSVCDLHDCTN